VIRPIRLTAFSENQTLPSLPDATIRGSAPAVGSGYSVRPPVSVMAPIALPARSLKYTRPSAPAATPKGALSGLVSAYSLILFVVSDILAIRPAAFSAIHIVRDGPAATPSGPDPGVRCNTTRAPVPSCTMSGSPAAPRWAVGPERTSFPPLELGAQPAAVSSQENATKA